MNERIETFINGETVITAEYENAIQDAIIENSGRIDTNDAAIQNLGTCKADAAALANETAAREFADTALSGDISDLQNALGDLAVPGANLFDVGSAVSGKYIAADGTEKTRSGLVHSSYIAVIPGKSYSLNYVVGSTTYPTIVQFDSSKTVIADAAQFLTTSPATFTPNASAAFVVVNASTTRAPELVFSDLTETYTPFKLVGSGNVSQAHLVSSSVIFYDGANLTSKTDMTIITPRAAKNIGQSVNVGAGAFLLYNDDTTTLYAANEAAVGKSIYLVCPLSKTEFSDPRVFSAYVSKQPIEFDPIAKTVKIWKANSYIYHRGTYYSLSGAATTLTATANHFLVYYSISDQDFHITSSYNSVGKDDVLILDAAYGAVSSISPIKVINNQHAKSGETYYTFGDSLTWYNGQPFTWGEHEGETCIGFQSYLNAYNGMTLGVNYGQSGKTTPQICDRLKSNIANIANNSTVFIMGGDNDDRLGTPIGTLLPVGSAFDTTTLYGALQSAIETLLAAKPTVRIILMTEPMGWTYNAEDGMKRVSDLIPNAYRKTAEQYGLPLIDLWAKSGINELTRETYYADKPVSLNTLYMYHPNNDGWLRLSKVICNEVQKY